MCTSDEFDIVWELCELFEQLSNFFFDLYNQRFIESYLEEQEAKYGDQKLQENE